jgi:glycosyltransferase involved in cell wall biosynthesis
VKICLISHSRIADDPRVRRHGDALAAAGHDVVGIGSAGARRTAPHWPVHELPEPDRGGLERVVRLPVARLGPGPALRLWRSDPANRAWTEAVATTRADVYVANDWPVLPLAAALAADHGGRYVYDSHEYAVQEHAERPKWQIFYPPYIRNIERALTPGASAVVTVSAGIAALLQRDLGLARSPVVIRNVPCAETVPEHDVHEPISILYQGIFAPDRGIETLIDSVRNWSPGRELVLRGSGDAAYLARLRRRAQTSTDGNHALVRFEPPVEPGQLIARAATADVGVHPIAGRTDQTRFCLPNKFFEYVMAGLAVCVSDLPEMRRLVAEHSLGWLIPAHTAEAIADTVNAMTPETVQHHRASARAAAQALSWESESTKLLAVFERLSSGQ